MSKTEQCGVKGCDHAAGATLDSESLCQVHFISACYAQLERYDEMQKTHRLSISDAESARRFINQCSRQADEIENGTKNLDNLDRARLLHIILWANELGRHLRRSPRKVASIPVRVCCDKLGSAWEEETQTVLLSRHGASLRCGHSAKPGEAVQFVRLDTGQEVQARVAWQRPAESDGIRIGVEFVDCENFWGLDWGAVEETRSDPRK
jgi:hypothetical protein